MKFYLAFLACAFVGVVNAATPSTNAIEEKSVLATATPTPAPEAATQATQESQAAPQKCCNLTDKKVIYKNKRNIAPCAIQQGVNLSYCETGVDACCNRVSHLENVDVPVCVPPCSCKEEVTVSKNGRKVVHDYGRYEVVLKARHDGNIEVNYRKRLFNR